MKQVEQMDHKHGVSAGELNANFEAAVAMAFCAEDEAMLKTMKVVYWLDSGNLPLTKYESLMQLLQVKTLECQKLGV